MGRDTNVDNPYNHQVRQNAEWKVHKRQFWSSGLPCRCDVTSGSHVFREKFVQSPSNFVPGPKTLFNRSHILFGSDPCLCAR